MKFKKLFTVLVIFMLLCVGVVFAVDNSSDEGRGSITYEEFEDDFVPQDDNIFDFKTHHFKQKIVDLTNK